MTNFQRELLKEREKISFNYEKYDIKIQYIENEIEDNFQASLNIILEYYYYFDSSLLNIEGLLDRFIKQNIISENHFKETITKEDFKFKHEVVFNICLDELNKNIDLTKLDEQEIEKYIREKINSKEFKDIVFNIGLVEAISYYKIFPVKNFIIAGELDEFQKEWWKKLFFKGLGEYRYLNNLLSIEEEDFLNIIANPKIDEYLPEEKTDNQYVDLEKQGFLIPIGGGKDSVVTLELLKEFKNENTIFSIEHKGARIKTAKTAGYSDSEVVKANRNFDKSLSLRNEQGFFNGHIPFSAVLAFQSLLVAFLLNKKYIPLSNESSANESTVEGLDINHQYSKSIEFETDIRNYIEYLNIDIQYFSLLRPLTEVGIVKIFVQNEDYFHVFNSCNVGSKGDEWHWCCDCSKCLFAYIILAPFLYKDKLVDIFGSDIFENERLLEDMFKLIGRRDAKPFECVGTIAETKFSLNELMDRLIMEENEKENKNKKDKTHNKEKLPILLEEYKKIYINEKNKIKNKLELKEIKLTEIIDENKNLYYVYNNNNYVPSFLEQIIKSKIQGEE